MTKLIITAIVTVVGAVLWFWKRYFSVSTEIKRKKERRRQIRKEMRDALRDRDYIHYHSLSNERVQINIDINELRG